MTNPRPNPYPGPRSFQRGEKLYGRERETAELLDLLIAERIVLLSSPSGAGKTSLVQAALIPVLEEEGFRVLPVMRPGLPDPRRGDPSVVAPSVVAHSAGDQGGHGGTAPTMVAPANRYILSLLLSLERELPEAGQTPLAELAGTSLAGYLDRLPPAPEGGRRGDVLIFDQFEEVLTVDLTDRDAKLAFFDQVGQALRERNRWALFSMREEFVAALDPYLRPIPARFDKGRRYRLDLLGPDAARAAMQGPAADQDPPVAFTDAAARKLADDLRRVQVQQPDGTMTATFGQYIEPVQLQVVCRRLWDGLAPDDMTIDLDDLAAVGDVDTALRGYYADTVKAVAEQTGVRERAIREWADRQLITEAGIRGQVLKGRERSPEGDDGLDNAAIKRLEDAHLVRSEQRRGATWFELAHDRLIAPVRMDNASWFEAHLSTLQRQAALWEQQKRPDGLLLSGEALAEAERWAGAQTEVLEPHEQDFLTACREARERTERERRQARRIRILAAVAAGVAIIALIAFVYATTQASEAARQREVAIAQQKVAVEQKSIADRNAAEAGRQKNIAEENAAEAQRQKAEAERQADAANQEKQRAELSAAEAERQRGVAEAEKKRADEKAREAESEARRAKAGELAAVAQTYAEDYPQRSLLLAVESLTTTLRYEEGVYSGGVQALRDLLAATGGIVLSQASSPGSRVIESGKGNGLVVVQEEGGVHLWPLRGTAIPTDLHQVDGIPEAASHDGRWLITQVVTGTSSGQESRLWDMELLNAQSKGEYIDGLSPSFSLDNRWLATKSLDRPGTTALYSLTNPGAPPGYLDGDLMEFSSDGRWLVTAIAGDSTVLWRLTEDATQPARFVVEGNSAGFSPDAQWLATQDANSTTRVWDVRSSLPVTRVVLTDTLPAPASGEQGVTAKTSSPTSHTRISPSKPSPFSPDGRWLLTSSEQGTSKAIRLWDLTDDKQPPRAWDLSGVPLAFSPDGRWLAARWPTEGTRALTERTSLWELTPDGPKETTIGEEAVGFDASSHWFVTASEWLASATLWNLESPDPRAQPITLRGPDDSGSSFLVLSPDQTSLVMAGRWKPTTLVWKLTRDLASRPSPLELHGSEGGISQVVFSGDGQWIGLQGGNFSSDKSIRLWNLGYPRQSGEPVAFDGDLGQWLGVASSPDNRWVLTWDSYDPANLWDLELRPVQTMPLSVEPKVVNAAFSAQSEWLITEHDDGSIYLWRLGASPLSPMPLADFSPEGVQAATGEGDWFVAQPSDASTSRLAVLDRRRASRPAASEYQELAARCFDDPEGYLVSPDRRWLVLSRSSRDPDIYLCRIAAETTLPIILKGHEDGILTLSISPDGHWLASGARDTTARLWDLTVDDPNTQVTVVRGHSNVVSTVAFSPDSRLMMSIASNGYSASVQITRTRLEELLDLACQVPGRNLSQDEWHRFVTAEPYRKTCEQWLAGD